MTLNPKQRDFERALREMISAGEAPEEDMRRWAKMLAEEAGMVYLSAFARRPQYEKAAQTYLLLCAPPSSPPSPPSRSASHEHDRPPGMARFGTN